VILPCIHAELFEDSLTGETLACALRNASWLCVTSPRGAEAVARLAMPLHAELKIAAVGEATANAVRALFAREPFVARGGTSRALGAELATLLGETISSTRIVVAAAAGGRSDAEVALAREGAIVSRINVYRTVPASRSETLRDLAAEQIDDVLLASPSAVAGLLNQASIPAGARIFAIGPTTSAAIVAAGLLVTGEAARPDFESLLEAMQ
jgi:uroporphyrinogen-III synthase